MKNIINYIVQGFGYIDSQDLITTLVKTTTPKLLVAMSVTSITLGTIREFIEVNIGLDIVVLGVFAYLNIAEWQTGIKVSIRRGKKIKSRKIGRMILKIGVYVSILFILHTFAEKTKSINFESFEINPMRWLYHAVFVGIVFQLFISYMENLGNLGYKEAKGIAGIVLRKFNKWFEFDGGQDGDNFNDNQNEN